MGSDLFIKYALSAMTMSYRLFGTKIVNAVVDNTAGSIFTAGVTIPNLVSQINLLEQKSQGGIGCYVVEGLENYNDQKFEEFFNFSMESVKLITQDKTEGHFALKLTAFMSMQEMTRFSKAQDFYK